MSNQVRKSPFPLSDRKGGHTGRLAWLLGRFWTIFLLLIHTSLWAAEASYSVEFQGIHNPQILRSIKSSSQLIALKKKAPSSINALRFRAESDIVELTRVLHALGYFEAKINVKIDDGKGRYLVIVAIDLGPLYTIDQYTILVEEKGEDPPPLPSLEEIGISPGEAAETKKILDSELSLLQLISERGFPLGKIEDREITADGKTKTVKVELKLKMGPLAHFGNTTIHGNTSVSPLLILQQLKWVKGEQYDSALVEESQKTLIDTGLFSSVYIIHAKALDPEGGLGMRVEVTETKHKSVSLGASYLTTYGPGATIGWENRNVSGLGRKVTLQADIAQKTHSGIVSYHIPNFHRLGQNYIIQAQATHEAIVPYQMQSYSLLSRLDRQLNASLFFSIGPKLEYLLVSKSVEDGNTLLFEFPLYLRWTTVKDLLNPLSGVRIEYRSSLSIRFREHSPIYWSHLLTASTYWPIWQEERCILAQKITLGTIWSGNLEDIPVPKRFFGGSEDNLRGYRYFTVSSLTPNEKPIGGRSAIYYTIEPRFRLSKNFGIVPFFDLGNVYTQSLPTFKGVWRKSVGIGGRYFSFVGPLRVDVAFPLDRRENIDPHWWVFVSLGQTF